ncbi:MAG: hypothetical protein Q9218_000916 [Villophora microphyllina]
MAHHQQPLQDRLSSAQNALATNQHGAPSKPAGAEDDMSTELDEPPDDLIRLPQETPFKTSFSPKPKLQLSSMAHSRKTSLLTQALAVSPGSIPNSDVDTPHLTSDGGLTSPARTSSPSPPLPATRPSTFAISSSQDPRPADNKPYQLSIKPPVEAEIADSAREIDVEVGLGRRRCIKFACGRQAATQPENIQNTKTDAHQREAPSNPQKRPCMLKFVCPMKPSSTSGASRPSSKETNSSGQQPSKANPITPAIPSKGIEQGRTPSSSNSGLQKDAPVPHSIKHLRSLHPFNRIDLEGSEATRFHEFAGPYNGEDEWIHEQTAYRRKMTVDDTLQKENAIRKIGEEAEEEALDEEDAADEDDEYNQLVDPDHGLSSEGNMSDAGNETDDEEGFAESDEESEMGSDFQFWPPGLTTAATSADHLEQVKATGPRTSSRSSIESMINVNDTESASATTQRRTRKVSRTQPVKMRPGTPDLPDSTDFVCGTLDEDRPLEAAYMSCLEERRRSKHRIFPQDIDPSFPPSDPELDEDDEENIALVHASDEPDWLMGKPDRSDEELGLPQRKSLSRRNTKSPMPSPKRMRSPPPQRRSIIHRSPPPSAMALHASASSSPTSSCDNEDSAQPAAGKPTWTAAEPLKPPKMIACHLPQRAQLTHTASLPRTPNPFWAPSPQWSHELPGAVLPKSQNPDVLSRGPIDIVTGLEKKRQRRKEKFWRQHGRNGAAKEKERRCQPGKGAERMRELGLEMAGKNKGYLPQLQLMLSI